MPIGTSDTINLKPRDIFLNFFFFFCSSLGDLVSQVLFYGVVLVISQYFYLVVSLA